MQLVGLSAGNGLWHIPPHLILRKAYASYASILTSILWVLTSMHFLWVYDLLFMHVRGHVGGPFYIWLILERCGVCHSVPMSPFGAPKFMVCFKTVAELRPLNSTIVLKHNTTFSGAERRSIDSSIRAFPGGVITFSHTHHDPWPVHKLWPRAGTGALLHR